MLYNLRWVPSSSDDESMEFYDSGYYQGDQRGGMHTNDRLHVKLITISSNGPYNKEERSDLNPSTSV